MKHQIQDLVSGVHAEHKHCLKSCIGLYKLIQQKRVHRPLLCSIAQMSWPSFGPPRPKQCVLAVRRTSGRIVLLPTEAVATTFAQLNRVTVNDSVFVVRLCIGLCHEFRRCFVSASEITIAEQIYIVSVV